MKRQIQVLTIVLILVISTLFASCSPKQQGVSSGGPSDASDNTTSSGEVSDNKGLSENVTISVLVPGNVQSFYDGEDENNNDIHTYLEENSGYNLEYRILPSDGESAKQKLTLEIASDDPADMIYLTGRDIFLQFASEGYLMALDEYIPNSPGLQETEYIKNPNVYNMATVDGKQYAITTPTNGASTSVSFAGLEEFSEFTEPGGMELNNIKEMFANIKEKYPDKIVYSGAGSETGSYMLASFNWLYGAFGLANTWRETSDGKLEYSATTQDMRDCLTFIADMNANGYLDPEYATLDTERVVQKMVSKDVSTAGIGWYSWPGYALTLSEGNTWGLYGNAVGLDGRTGQSIGSPVHGYAVVTSGCEHSQDVVDYIAFLCKPETYNYIFYGTEGKDYEINGKGEWILKLEEGCRNSPKGNMNYLVYYYIYENTEQRTLRLARLAYGIPEKIKIHTFYPSLKIIDDPVADKPSIEIYNDKINDINDLCAEYFTKIATGALPLSAFDEFLERFDTIGGNQVVDAMNEWYTNK